ncbi:MAG: outer membrane lipoprotein-sorting protein [Cyclobacteriaceae bacterium]|nr:outer membrane lipoprotein-sorting protein [Cyclobacteriaceae bacterium HetDA_MAG_MS6]
MKNLIIALSIAFSLSALAQSAEQKGLDVAKKADLVDQGFESSSVKLTMVLTNKQGQESTRYLETKTLELTEDGDKSLIVFNSPKDVEGTATLTFTHKVGSDDQWLYLPALKRVKRISSSNKSGPFMGSEFAYEDLSSQEVEKYNYKYIELKDGNHVVERYPLDPKSGYTKQVVYWNTDNLRIEKTDFYDRKGALLKTLVYQDYNLYLGKHWRANTFLMENHQTGKKTKLIFKDYDFKIGLSDNDFSQNSLVRAGR